MGLFKTKEEKERKKECERQETQEKEDSISKSNERYFNYDDYRGLGYIAKKLFGIKTKWRMWEKGKITDEISIHFELCRRIEALENKIMNMEKKE